VDRDSITGYAFGDYVAKEDQKVFQDHVRKCAGDRTETTSELRLVRKDGQSIAVQFHSIPIDGPKEDTLCKTAITDITQRKNMEETIRQSRVFLQTVIDAIPDALLVIGQDYRIALANRAAREMAGGIDPAGCLTCHQLSHHSAVPCEGLKEPCPLRAVIASRAPIRVTHTHYDDHGNEVFVEISAAPVFNAAGEVSHIVEACCDVTERMRLERALRLTQVSVEYAGDAVFWLGPDARFFYANARACRHLGYSREELLSMTVHDVDPGFPAEVWPKHWEEVKRRGSFTFESRHRTKEGELVPVEITVNWLEFEGKEYNCAFVRDITDHKRAEEELRAARESADRAKAAAEQANRAKDHFLAVLSHELRTPLMPVVMGVSMLQDRPGIAPEVRETLEMVRRNVEMEVQLIDDLLDVTRIARGKIELNLGTVELCTVIHRAVEVCKPDIEARRLHFSEDRGPAAPYWIRADLPRLQQVFWNLLQNAIKFTPYGGRLRVRCRSHDAHVLVEVQDSGIGIEPEAQPRIFDAFEQVERSITRQFGGLGLGLAICKSLVEMHGGTIEVHSEGRDKGTTFRIRLPLSAPADQPEMPSPTAPPRRAARSLNILLVEDHGVTAKLMRMVLNSDGHTVETAGGMVTALELADRHPFDLLISDLGLPDGSGHDLMRQLRGRGHTLPGIVLSGYGQEEDIQLSYQSGFAVHLTKPASREAVLEAVASVTAGK
jgi:PAS domain S-box-containing protein